MSAAGAQDHFAHTAQAEENRAIKAAALAAAARASGVPVAELAIGRGGRRAVWKAAGLDRAPSEATWAAVADLMASDEPPAGPRPQSCRHHPSRPGRLYLGGRLCDECAPWARAGHPEPRPPVGSTLAELRAAARIAADVRPASSSTVIDERAIASGKRRSTTSTYQAVRAAQEHRARKTRTAGRR